MVIIVSIKFAPEMATNERTLLTKLVTARPSRERPLCRLHNK